MSNVLTKTHLQAIVVRLRAQFPEQRSKFIVGDAFKHLFMVTHLHGGINELILNNLQNLDPTIGDASCEMRVPLVIDMRKLYEGIAEDDDVPLVNAYIAAHARDRVDTQVRTFADAKGGEHDPAYDILVKRVVEALGERDTDLLRLCYSFTMSSVMSKDECGNLFSNRSKAAMVVAGDVALHSAAQKDLIKLEPMLRSALATDAVASFLEKFETIPRHEQLVGNFKQHFIENQLSRALQTMRSHIPYKFEYAGQVEQEEVPLLPIFNQMLAIFYMVFNDNGGILTRARLEDMAPLHSSVGKMLYTDRFAGAYFLLWKPNHGTGRFEVVDIRPEDEDVSCLVLDGWTKFLAGSNGKGLDASNLEEHRAAFKLLNIIWAGTVYAAGHPDYSNNAVDKDFDYLTGFDDICMPQPEGVINSFKATREDFPQFSLKKNLPNEVRPNLHNLWMIAREMAEQRGLHDECQPIRMTSTRDLFERINRPVDWQIDHIYAATPHQLKANTDLLIAKHTAAPQQKLGPHIVRSGEEAFSFENLADAQVVLKLRDNKRKPEYIKRVPENATFVV